MGTMGICYTMMNTPETSMIVNITGHQTVLTYELDTAQWDYTSQSATKGVGVAVSKATDIHGSEVDKNTFLDKQTFILLVEIIHSYNYQGVKVMFDV